MSRKRLRNDQQWTAMHCCNRIAGMPGEYPFGEPEQKKMFALLEQLSLLYTVEIVSVCIMHSHYHIVVMCPPEGYFPGKREVKKRFRAYYGKARANAMDWTNEEFVRQLAERMRNVSHLLKDFQHRFTCWFNRTRAKRRRGHLWADRYKSTILQQRNVLWECVKYVEMNPIRAGLCKFVIAIPL